MNAIQEFLKNNKRNIGLVILGITSLCEIVGIEIPQQVRILLFSAGASMGGIGAIHGVKKIKLKDSLETKVLSLETINKALNSRVKKSK